MLENRHIVILASAPWQNVGPVNCHHIATRLAARNKVLFVESPGLRFPRLTHRADLQKVGRRLSAWVRSVGRAPPLVRPNLFVLSPLAAPFHGRGLARRFNQMLRRACVRAARRLGFGSPIIWSFLPTGLPLVGCLDEEGVIYHCVDYYAGNPGVDANAIERHEAELALAADLCLATSRPLARRLQNLGARVKCVPNVAEVERFRAPPDRLPEDVAGLPSPVMGYVGNVASYKTDLRLLAGLARGRPRWSLVIVGPLGVGDPSTDPAELRSLPNVHLLGPRRPEEVPGYIHAMDVCLIPFRRNAVTDASLPLKTFEYLAAGKPVVATPLPALTAEPVAEVVAFAEGPDGFITAS